MIILGLSKEVPVLAVSGLTFLGKLKLKYVRSVSKALSLKG